MVFQPVENTLEVILDLQTADGQDLFQNSLYFENEAGWPSAPAAAVADAVADIWASQVMENLCDDLNFWRVRWRDLGAEFGVNGEDARDTNGAIATEMTSLALAMGVRFRAATGPPKRGGIFVCGLPEAALESQLWGATAADNVEQNVQNACEAGEAAYVGTEHVIVSRFERAVPGPGSVPRDPALTADVETYQAIRPVWTQRDRRPGQGS